MITLSDTTEAAQTIDLALGASIDDVVHLVDADGAEYLFGTHAAVYESDGHDLYVLQDGTTGYTVSDAYNSRDVAADAAQMGLTLMEG